MQSPTRVVGLVLAVTGMALGAATSASAATTATWSCRASAIELQLANNSRVMPVVSDRTPCSDGVTGVPNLGQALGLAPGVTAQTAFASTSAAPPNVFPKDQTVASASGIEGLEVKLFGGSLTIGVDAARSAATGKCVGGNPVFTADSTAVKLRINGQEIMLDGLLSSIVDPISNSPLGQVVQVKLNEQIKDANGGGGASGSGGNGTDGLPQVCPTGSTLDRARGLCIIAADKSGGQGVIIIGVPFSGPSGGTVLSLVNARKRFKSICLQGPGPKFATVGTNRADRITGTNRPDRILGLGGNDAIDGGRENDCADGGTGGDNLSGGLGNDRVYGVSGKDHLNGGPGNDRLFGGSGNDTINAAFGKDVAFGGSGNDFINVATAGPAARVDCGSGRDKVRINNNEKRRIKGCETSYVFRDR